MRRIEPKLTAFLDLHVSSLSARFIRQSTAGKGEDRQDEAAESLNLDDLEAQPKRRRHHRQISMRRVNTSVTAEPVVPASTPVSAVQLEARLLDVSSATEQPPTPTGDRPQR